LLIFVVKKKFEKFEMKTENEIPDKIVVTVIQHNFKPTTTNIKCQDEEKEEKD
jgi:hypothetical protein